MQKRIDAPFRGYAVIYNKDALRFVLRWHEPMRVSKSWINGIEMAAASPNDFFSKNVYTRLYSREPDLAAALLNRMRQKWSRLETSKAGKLKKFLSQNTAAKWERGFGAPADQGGNVSLWDLQDGEIATAFEKSPGGQTVTPDDVCKARKWVAANIRAGEKFAIKVLDKDGFLCVKGKFYRRK
jgi:hypothetical protein